MVAPITKYAVTVTDPHKIKILLGAAIYAATSGRKGPAWIDIPLDIQAANIEPSQIPEFTRVENEWDAYRKEEAIKCGVSAVKEAIRNVSKPAIFAGYGIISSNAEKQFFDLMDKLKCPILTTWKSLGLLSDNNPLYCGRPGGIGQRAANKIQQTCDFILVLGAKLDFDQTAYQLSTFAPLAKKIVVDIDPAELAKFDDSWVKVNADIKDFLLALKIDGEYMAWLKQCKEMQKENKY